MNLTISAAQSLNTAVAGVIGRMSIGVLATMLVAALVESAGLVPVLFGGILGYVIIFAPLVLSLLIGFLGERMTTATIKALYFVFAATMGVSLSLLFSVYTAGSIAQALLSTTVSFVALAGWGYFTRRDLRGWGPFLFAGVIGLIVASVVGIFVSSTALQMTINVLSIIIFLALTAYDMNRIRDMFWGVELQEVERMQWFGALSLYINFINIFISMLQLFGDRK